MTHICVISSKGGVGKTILSTNLADAYALAGLRVCLVDHDPQGGSLIFGGLASKADRQLRFVPTTVVVPGFDLYIHDFPPGIHDRYPGEVLVMPVVLDAPSGAVHLRGRQVLASRGHSILEVVSRYRNDRCEPRKLLEEKYSHCPVLRDRTLYPNRYGLGKTVFDTPNARFLERAQAEILAVKQAIDSVLEGVA